MHSMVQNKDFFLENMLPRKAEENEMEKIYLTMKRAGVLNIVFGILLAVGSLLTAVGSAFMIMYGAKLLKKKSELMF